MRKKWSICGDDDDNRTATFQFWRSWRILCAASCGARRNAARPFTTQRLRQRRASSQICNLLSNRNAQDSQVTAIVTLDQHADCVATLLGSQDARRRTDPTFKSVAAHSSSTADCSFLHRSRLRVIKCVQRMKWFDVFTIRIVEGVKGLGNYWIRKHKVPAVLNLPLDGSVANRPHTVCTGQ